MPPSPEESTNARTKARLVTNIHEVSGMLSGLLPTLVQTRSELANKLGDDEPTVVAFNDLAMDIASVNGTLRRLSASLTARVSPTAEEQAMMLESLDGARQMWTRAMESFSTIEDSYPPALMAKKLKNQMSVGWISPDEVQERWHNALAALAGISKDEWRAIQEQSHAEVMQQEALYKYYERSLKKLAAGVDLVDERVARVLDLARDVTEDMGTRTI